MNDEFSVVFEALRAHSNAWLQIDRVREPVQREAHIVGPREHGIASLALSRLKCDAHRVATRVRRSQRDAIRVGGRLLREPHAHDDGQALRRNACCGEMRAKLLEQQALAFDAPVVNART